MTGREFENDIPLSAIYAALDGINDEVVGLAMESLRQVQTPPELMKTPSGPDTESGC